MAVTLTIKNVPERLVKELKRRAAAHHRSLQGELMTVLEQAAMTLTLDEALDRIRRRGLHTEGDSTAIIRQARDARAGR